MDINFFISINFSDIITFYYLFHHGSYKINGKKYRFLYL